MTKTNEVEEIYAARRKYLRQAYAATIGAAGLSLMTIPVTISAAQTLIESPQVPLLDKAADRMGLDKTSTKIAAVAMIPLLTPALIYAVLSYSKTQIAKQLNLAHETETAYHEAGHVLAVLAVYGNENLKTLSASITPKKLYSGHVKYETNKPFARRDLFGSIFTHVAGKTGAKVRYGEDFKASGCGSDYWRAKLIIWLCEIRYSEKLDIDQTIKMAESFSFTIITKYREELDRLAQALLEKKELSFEEIINAIGKDSPLLSRKPEDFHIEANLA